MAISGAFMAQFRPNLAGTLNQALHTTSDQSWPESANTQIWPVPVTLGGCGSKFAHVSSISAQLFARIDPHLGRCRLNMARLCSTSPPKLWLESGESGPNATGAGPISAHSGPDSAIFWWIGEIWAGPWRTSARIPRIRLGALPEPCLAKEAQGFESRPPTTLPTRLSSRRTGSANSSADMRLSCCASLKEMLSKPSA